MNDKSTQCYPNIGSGVRSMIRLTEQDLRRVFQVGSTMIEDFYPEQVIMDTFFLSTLQPGNAHLNSEVEGSLTSLTSCHYRIYLLGISCVRSCGNFFHFPNNLLRTSKDGRSDVCDTSSFRTKLGVPCFNSQSLDLSLPVIYAASLSSYLGVCCLNGSQAWLP